MGGPSAFGIYMFSLCNGISLYFLIIWLFQMGAHWLHWKAKSSLWSLAVSNGGGGIIISFPYIFLLFDCFKWVLIDHIIKCRLHSMLWQFWMGRGVHSDLWQFQIILPLVSTCLLYVLLFPYIFLLFDCFQWALIDRIENGGGGIIISFPYIFLLFDCFKWVLIDHIIKCRLHSMLWQFQMGRGVHLPLVSTCFLYALVFPYIFYYSAFGIYMFALCAVISLYLPIIWLFRMGTHWLHWKV